MWWLMIAVILLVIVSVEAAIEDESRIGYLTSAIAGFIIFTIGLYEGDNLDRTSDEVIKPITKVVCEEIDGIKKCDTTYIYKFKEDKDE